MHCLKTLERLNAEKVEASRLLNARHPAANPAPAKPLPERENPHAVIKRIMDGAKG